MNLVDCTSGGKSTCQDHDDWEFEWGINGAASPTKFDAEDMTCVTWTEFDCTYNACLPICFCNVEHVYALNS